MTKEEKTEYHKIWRNNKGTLYKEQHRLRNYKWVNDNKDYVLEYKKQNKRNRRKMGITNFCCKNYELIENYELAKLDEFDKNKWVLHHRDEAYYSSKYLKENNLYNSLTPDKLIWLPYNEHHDDQILSIKHPELSIWHQRIYDR